MNEVKRAILDAKKYKVKIVIAAKNVGVSRCNIYHALHNGRITPISLRPAEFKLLREIQRMCKERKELISKKQ